MTDIVSPAPYVPTRHQVDVAVQILEGSSDALLLEAARATVHAYLVAQIALPLSVPGSIYTYGSI